MTDNGREILEAVLKIQKTTNDTQSDVKLFRQDLETLNNTVKKHDQIIFGDPEQMGKGGLVYTTQQQESKIGSIKRELKRVRNIFAVIWTSIVTAINIFITIFFRRN